MYYVLLFLAEALLKSIPTLVLQYFKASHLRFDFEIASFSSSKALMDLILIISLKTMMEGGALPCLPLAGHLPQARE